MSGNPLCLQGVEKRYGSTQVLKGLSLSIEAGEIYGLLGPNGAGKTTAIRIATGLVEADAGEVTILGVSPAEAPREWVGLVPQEIALYPHLSVAQNLRFLAGLYGIRGRTRKARITEVLEVFCLTPWQDTLVSALSGGWQRRVNLAAGFLHRPQILILDEPTSGLDMEARSEAHGIIRSVAREGAAVMLTSHLFDEMSLLSHRVGILHDGRLVREGTVAELTAALPFRQVAYVETPQPERVRRAAEGAGWATEGGDSQLTLRLPEGVTLASLVERLKDVPLNAVSLEPASLAHAYLDALSGPVPRGA